MAWVELKFSIWFICAEEVGSIRIPCKHPKLGLVFETYPILHPHRILNYLFDVAGLKVDAEDVRAFWRHTRGVREPWAMASPATDSHVPLGLHGDGARLLTHVRFEKHVALWLNLPLWRPKSVRFSRWLLFSMPNEKQYKNRSLNVVWNRLVWSFQACFDGVHPLHGPGGGGHRTRKDRELAGMPLTRDRLQFVVTEIRGDWEFHRDVWRPTASWTGKVICFKCPAMTKEVPWSGLAYNFGSCPEDGCQWINEEFTLEEFVANRLKSKNLCPLQREKHLSPKSWN